MSKSSKRGKAKPPPSKGTSEAKKRSSSSVKKKATEKKGLPNSRKQSIHSKRKTPVEHDKTRNAKEVKEIQKLKKHTGQNKKEPRSNTGLRKASKIETSLDNTGNDEVAPNLGGTKKPVGLNRTIHSDSSVHSIVEELRRMSPFFSGSRQSSPEQLLIEALNAEKPCYFLSILPEKPRILVVHGLSTMTMASFGTGNLLRGRVLGFMGTLDHDGTPKILIAPEIGVADRFFTLKSVSVPDDEDLRSKFTKCPSGSLCQPSKKSQCEQHGLWRLIPIPVEWAQPFIENSASTPFQAYKIIFDATMTLPGNERHHANYLLMWLRATCCAKTCDADDSETSQMSINWTEVVAPSRKLINWAKYRMRKRMGQKADCLP